MKTKNVAKKLLYTVCCFAAFSNCTISSVAAESHENEINKFNLEELPWKWFITVSTLLKTEAGNKMEVDDIRSVNASGTTYIKTWKVWLPMDEVMVVLRSFFLQGVGAATFHIPMKQRTDNLVFVAERSGTGLGSHVLTILDAISYFIHSSETHTLNLHEFLIKLKKISNVTDNVYKNIITDIMSNTVSSLEAIVSYTEILDLTAEKVITPYSPASQGAFSGRILSKRQAAQGTNNSNEEVAIGKELNNVNSSESLSVALSTNSSAKEQTILPRENETEIFVSDVPTEVITNSERRSTVTSPTNISRIETISPRENETEMFVSDVQTEVITNSERRSTVTSPTNISRIETNFPRENETEMLVSDVPTEVITNTERSLSVTLSMNSNSESEIEIFVSDVPTEIITNTERRLSVTLSMNSNSSKNEENIFLQDNKTEKFVSAVPTESITNIVRSSVTIPTNISRNNIFLPLSEVPTEIISNTERIQTHIVEFLNSKENASVLSVIHNSSTTENTTLKPNEMTIVPSAHKANSTFFSAETLKNSSNSRGMIDSIFTLKENATEGNASSFTSSTISTRLTKLNSETKSHTSSTSEEKRNSTDSSESDNFHTVTDPHNRLNKNDSHFNITSSSDRNRDLIGTTELSKDSNSNDSSSEVPPPKLQAITRLSGNISAQDRNDTRNVFTALPLQFVTEHLKTFLEDNGTSSANTLNDNILIATIVTQPSTVPTFGQTANIFAEATKVNEVTHSKLNLTSFTEDNHSERTTTAAKQEIHKHWVPQFNFPTDTNATSIVFSVVDTNPHGGLNKNAHSQTVATVHQNITNQNVSGLNNLTSTNLSVSQNITELRLNLSDLKVTANNFSDEITESANRFHTTVVSNTTYIPLPYASRKPTSNHVVASTISFEEALRNRLGGKLKQHSKTGKLPSRPKTIKTKTNRRKYGRNMDFVNDTEWFILDSEISEDNESTEVENVTRSAVLKRMLNIFTSETTSFAPIETPTRDLCNAAFECNISLNERCIREGDRKVCSCGRAFERNVESSVCEPILVDGSNPCANEGLTYCSSNAECIEELRNKSGYYCVCVEDFTDSSPFPDLYPGENCEERELCDGNYCKNGGVCVNNDGDFFCSCPFGYSGYQCEFFVLNTSLLVTGGIILASLLCCLIPLIVAYCLRKCGHFKVKRHHVGETRTLSVRPVLNRSFTSS